MSDHHTHDVHREVHRYLTVFCCLIVGTVLTVGAYYLHLPSVALTIAVALFIASVKAFLVAGYFMHLLSERKMIYGILAATVFFVTGLMYLTVWSMHWTSLIHIKHVS
jgi:cytochrome c oxidase subunit IV